MMVAFRKPLRLAEQGVVGGGIYAAHTKEEIRFGHELFRKQLGLIRNTLERLIHHGTPAVGYGAAQMVPTLAYHMQTDFGFLEAILDDNPAKARTELSKHRHEHRAFLEPSRSSQFAVVLTACDSARRLLPQLTGRRARYIASACNPTEGLPCTPSSKSPFLAAAT